MAEQYMTRENDSVNSGTQRNTKQNRNSVVTRNRTQRLARNENHLQLGVKLIQNSANNAETNQRSN